MLLRLGTLCVNFRDLTILSSANTFNKKDKKMHKDGACLYKLWCQISAHYLEMHKHFDTTTKFLRASVLCYCG